MNTLVIACSSKDREEIERHNFVQGIKDAFKAESLEWCDSAECLKQRSQEVDYILYFTSFKGLTYSQVVSLARASSTVDRILGVEFKNDKMWIYNRGMVVNCISPDGIVKALDDAITLDDNLPKIGGAILAIILVILMAITIIYKEKTSCNAVYADPIRASAIDTQYDLDGSVIK